MPTAGPVQLPSDEKWLHSAFRITEDDYKNIDSNLLYGSSADRAFYDTSLGGGVAINMPPGFTPFADIQRRGLGGVPLYNDDGKPDAVAISGGIGRYYDENYVQNATLMHCRMGVPEYNSLGNFFANMYSPTAGRLASTGEVGILSTVIDWMGKLTGLVVKTLFLPVVAINKLYRFLTGKPNGKYYYLKPTQALYWNSANSIFNHIVNHLGIGDFSWPEGGWEEGSGAFGKIPKVKYTDQDKKSQKIKAGIFSDIYGEDGKPDIRAIATKFHRLAYQRNENLAAIFKSKFVSMDDMRKKLNEELDKPPIPNPVYPVMDKYLEAYLGSGIANTDQFDPVGDDSANAALGGWEGPDMIDYFKSEMRDGSGWVSFKVNGLKEVQESFSTEYGESELSGKINGFVDKIKNTKFNLANGNIGDNGLVDAAETIAKAGAQFLSSATEELGIGGISNLGTSYIEIPDQYKNSSATLPQIQVKIQLRAMDSSKESQMQDILAPYAMILPMILPIRTGKASYTQPFMGEFHIKGHRTIRLGAVTSASVTRGAGEQGWFKNGLPRAIDIDLTIADMEKIMSAPIEDFTSMFADNTAFNDYMKVLAASDVTSMISPVDRLSSRMSAALEGLSDRFSSAGIASMIAHELPLISTPFTWYRKVMKEIPRE